VYEKNYPKILGKFLEKMILILYDDT
ncbi:hypothetical protein EVA_22309, partial [gut metagenome]